MKRDTRERAHKKWWRYPVEVRFDAPMGESVADTPLSRHELEWLAGHGPLAPDEAIPPEPHRDGGPELSDGTEG